MSESSSLAAIDTLLEAIATRLRQIERSLVVAFDGRSGAGKSTLATQLGERCGGVIVRSDDFYRGAEGGVEARWDACSPEEKSNLVIDWRRLRTEALEPLVYGREAAYRPFDFAAGKGLAAKSVQLQPARLIILDGVYSTRPELDDLLDIRVLVEAEDAERRARLRAREGSDFMTKWHARWDEAEDHYFLHIRPRTAFDFLVANESQRRS